MRVFVAGASGAISTRLVAQLVERCHDVIGTFRSPGGGEGLRALGADPVMLDLLDARAVRKAVLESKPEAIAKAKRELGCTLRYPSWREGFVAAYATTVPAGRPEPPTAAIARHSAN